MSLRVFIKSFLYTSLTPRLFQNAGSVTLCSCIPKKFYSMKPSDHIILEVDPQTGEKKKKKTQIIPKVTLLSGDNNVIDVVTYEEADKIARRRDLKLVKVLDLDTKTQRPVYKLMTPAEYYAEDIKHKEQIKKQHSNSIKGEKVLTLGHNISEHDIQTNARKITKWLDKRYEVRIVINGDINNMGKAENVYKLLERDLIGIARFVQKREKGSDIKFQILPPKQEKQNDKNSENKNSVESSL